jgi:MazG C-terminal domain
VNRALLDDGWPVGEQLPRQVEAHFAAGSALSGTAALLVLNGRVLTRPAVDEDLTVAGHRWIDALYLAHAVCLGWSPVLRRTAGLRRSSTADVDQVEDAEAAVAVEQAIARTTFRYARDRQWLHKGHIQCGLIDEVRNMTAGLEVQTATRDAWAHTISSGLRCLRALWLNDGGVLIGDMRYRMLRIAAGRRPIVAGIEDGEFAPA